MTAFRRARLVAALANLSLAACEIASDNPSAAGPTQPSHVAGAGAHESPSLSAISASVTRKPTPYGLCTDPYCGGSTITAAQPPPPISGGTMLISHDGQLLVAADPDRDQIYFIDNVRHVLSHVRQFEPGDEPWRVIEDAEQRFHVALRGGRALATLTRDPAGPITRRAVCDLPRGLAYDATLDAIQLACAEGKLVTVPATPDAPAASQVISIDRDARDVIVRDDALFVTFFRSAQVLRMSRNGALEPRYTPPNLAHSATRHEFSPDGFVTSLEFIKVTSSPTLAWRALDVPGKGLTLLHQRADMSELSLSELGARTISGYSRSVQTAITTGLDTERTATASVMSTTLAVDMAVDPSGLLLALAAPGEWRTNARQQLVVLSLTGTSPLNSGSPLARHRREQVIDDTANLVAPAVSSLVQFPEQNGQVTSVVFTAKRELAVQMREPAAISYVDVSSEVGKETAFIDLKQASRFDSGHAFFHMATSSMIACASCHGEAGDDAHTWNFQDIGPRRTPSLRGGILDTAPFAWAGEQADFPSLMQDIFTLRLHVRAPNAYQVAAVGQWLNRQPAFVTTPRDAVAATRGRQLFESDELDCVRCHAGPHTTNNLSADVGKGQSLQVPTLRNVSFRTPLMHDGCAATLRDRFDIACGGSQHGHTEQLSPSQLDDLLEYLETL